MASSSYTEKSSDYIIRQALSTLKDDFFSSLEGGTMALKNFDNAWCSFSKVVHSCGDRLQAETLALVHAFSSIVESMALSFLELQTSSDDICYQFSADISNILNNSLGKLTLDDREMSNKGEFVLESIPSFLTCSPPLSSAAPHNSYIKPSYEWLLANLHDPYPSKDIRAAISLQSGYSRKEIDGWFIDARRRMGWNSLRKSRYQNRRVDIVDASTRFFLRPDPKRPLDPTAELEFAEIEVRAKDLYSEKFMESSLAAKLNVVVKDMTPEMKAEVKLVAKQRRQSERRRREERLRRKDPYPTPERSPGASPEPSLSPSDQENGFLATSSSRKRSSSFVEREGEDQHAVSSAKKRR